MNFGQKKERLSVFFSLHFVWWQNARETSESPGFQDFLPLEVLADQKETRTYQKNKEKKIISSVFYLADVSDILDHDEVTCYLCHLFFVKEFLCFDRLKSAKNLTRIRLKIDKISAKSAKID